MRIRLTTHAIHGGREGVHLDGCTHAASMVHLPHHRLAAGCIMPSHLLPSGCPHRIFWGTARAVTPKSTEWGTALVLPARKVKQPQDKQFRRLLTPGYRIAPPGHRLIKVGK